MSCLNEALDYWDHGYNPIPTIPGTRKTPVKWKEYQDRRVAEDEIRKWWGRGHGWDIAIVCGAISNCVVVDADSEVAVTYCKLNIGPTTFRVETNKGIHFYFRHPGHHVKSKARVIDDPPIDIRADGGLAQGFGSKHHATGKLYVISPGYDIASPADLPIYDPMWFPAIEPPAMSFIPVNVSGDSMTRASKYLNAIPAPHKGQRNSTAFRAAAIMTHDFGLDVSQAETLLREWNSRMEDPLPEHEISTICKSSVTSGKNGIGAKL